MITCRKRTLTKRKKKYHEAEFQDNSMLKDKVEKQFEK